MTTVDKADTVRAADIQVVSRVAALLECITLTTPSLDIQRAADVLGVGRSTAHRYLASMEKSLLLERDESGKYVLGPALVRIGAVAFAGPGILEAAGPVMLDLASSVGNTIVLSVWGGDSPVVARVERNTQQTTTVAVDVGRSLEPESAQAVVFDVYHGRTPRGTLPGVTEHPVPGAAGETVAVARTTFANGALRVIAVPVLNRAGTIIATLAVLGFAVSLPEAEDDAVIARLVAASRKLQTS